MNQKRKKPLTYLELLSRQRSGWHGVNPVTRISADRTKYDRRKLKDSTRREWKHSD